jgi:hypothetical protein
MIVVANASVLVAELARARGLALFLASRLRAVVAEEQWSEAQYELDRRLNIRAERGHLSDDQRVRTRDDIRSILGQGSIEVARLQTYGYLGLGPVARRRIPRDPDNWPTVALAIALPKSCQP